MTAILVSGALAARPNNAGGAWVRLSWAAGFTELGCDVWFVEEVAGATSEAISWFETVIRDFGLSGRCSLIDRSGQVLAGQGLSDLTNYARDCDLLVNLSGNLRCTRVLTSCSRRAFVDLDPGYTQSWIDSGINVGADGHDVYFSVAERIGTPGCSLPTAGAEWQPVRQPVVLSAWPPTIATSQERFTTIASWRTPFGPLDINGSHYGMKAHEFRKLAWLPSVAPGQFEIATDVQAGDEADRRLMESGGWTVVDSRGVAGDPNRFRTYVQGSGAEISPAQPVYVETRSGWFSDRSTRYLASGRPVLIQDTGLNGLLPIGEGLLTFSNPHEACAGAEAIQSDYLAHAAAARRLAETHFASRIVLSEFLERARVP